MKIKQHKAPDNLREKVDAKINLIKGMKDLAELFFKHNPKSVIDSLAEGKKKKK